MPVRGACLRRTDRHPRRPGDRQPQRQCGAMADRRGACAAALRGGPGHAAGAGRPRPHRSRRRHGLGRRQQRELHPRRVGAVSIALDHLVVAARTLDDGVAWCEASFGITPGPGGKHPRMSTHNRLFSIASPTFPRAYAEIMAIDADAPPPARARWFDLGTPTMRAAVARSPQLVHWVLRCDDIESRCAHWRAAGIERGEVIAAERETPRGLLRW